MSVADGNGSAIYNDDVRFHSRPSLNRQNEIEQLQSTVRQCKTARQEKKTKNKRVKKKERFCQPSTRVIQIPQSLTETRQNSLQISICDVQPASQPASKNTGKKNEDVNKEKNERQEIGGEKIEEKRDR